MRTLRSVLDDHRRIIVLLADHEVDARASLTGKLLFGELQEHVAASSNAVSESAPLAAKFLDWIETDPELRDGDRLAFREVVSALPGSARVQKLQTVLDGIAKRYDAEISRIFVPLGTRGLVDRREAWSQYLRFLQGRFDRTQILKAYESEWSAVLSNVRSNEPPWKDNDDEIVGRLLPEKTVVLTFDDGPHKKHTDQILKILDSYKIKGVFFQIGRNVKGVKDGSRKVLDAGHVLANHSYDHAFLPKLTAARLDKQFDDTNAGLRGVLNAEPILFRPPYGARNSNVMKAATTRKMKTVLWNVDSLDWADPVPRSIAARVVANLSKENRGIVLFHDIHARTVAALPLILEELKKQGYRFATWNGRGFSVPDDAETLVAPDASSLYRESWAVVVGINKYKKWPQLNYAVNDANGLSKLLINRFGFKADHVFSLMDADATRERILGVLGDRLSNPDLVKKDDRVFVFFAGHGVTRQLPNGRSLGYIVPVDADTESFQSQAISMTNFQDISESIPAKHVLFVMDACYSCLALIRGGAPAGGDHGKFLREITRRTARQVLTAGGADEQVADNGPGGHSIFTWTLMQALSGGADADGDGVITATELASNVVPSVSGLSHQTPAFGSLPGGEGGDFVFELRHEGEFLSDESKQLDGEAIALNSELLRLRNAIEEKRKRNALLAQQVASAQASLAGNAAINSTTAPTVPPSVGDDLARREIDRGMGLYREKRYEEAVSAFEAALKVTPTNALAANNLGFTFGKMNRLPEAITWYEKTIQLDPRRAVAYLNLGDAYFQANRANDARRVYEQYLQLAPSSRQSAEVRKKLLLGN